MTPDDVEDDDELDDDIEDEYDDEFEELNRSTATSTFLDQRWFRWAAIAFAGMVVFTFMLPLVLSVVRDGTSNAAPDPVDQGMPDFVLSSAGGGQIQLSDEAASHAAIVLVFHRGYDCLSCRDQLVELQTGYAALLAEGAELLVIGIDDQVGAERMAAHAKASYPVLYDPDGIIAATYGVADELAGDFTTTTLILDRSRNLAASPVGTIGDQLMPVSAILDVLRGLNGDSATPS
jgi:peroxiredoxin